LCSKFKLGCWVL